MSQDEQPQKRLQSIQAVRGVAASLVVFMHACNVAGAYSGSASLQAIAASTHPFGFFGVDLFFVVSGLIIGQQILRNRMSAQAFAWHRILRIYPLFWMTLAACILIPLPAPPLSGFAPLLDNPAALVLLANTKLHPVAWTLVFEIQFYVVATIALIFHSRAKVILLACSAVQLLLVIAAPQTALSKVAFLTPVSLEFCLGLLIAFYGRYLTIERPRMLIAAAIVLLVGLWAFDSADAGRNTAYRLVALGVPAAYVVAAALALEREGARVPMALVRLGDVSYSTYVWHVPVLGAMWSLFPVDSFTGGVTFVAGSLAACLIVSVVSFRFVETPLIAFGRRSMPAHLPVAAPAPTY